MSPSGSSSWITVLGFRCVIQRIKKKSIKKRHRFLRAAQVVSDIVQRHQAARARVSDDIVDAFMAVRPMPHLFG